MIIGWVTRFRWKRFGEDFPEAMMSRGNYEISLWAYAWVVYRAAYGRGRRAAREAATARVNAIRAYREALRS